MLGAEPNTLPLRLGPLSPPPPAAAPEGDVTMPYGPPP